MVKQEKQTPNLFECEVVMMNNDGLHARPAAIFAEKAARFESEITICAKNKKVDGKSIIDLLTLGAAKGTKLLIKAEGKDGKDAIDALVHLVKGDFNEISMIKKGGIVVNPGIAIGEAFVLPSEGYVIPRHFIKTEELSKEITKLESSIKDAQEEISQLESTVTDKLGKEIGNIFGAHKTLLGDERLKKQFIEKIKKHGYCAEYSVSVTLRSYIKKFDEIKDPYLAERVRDIYDIEKRLLRNLLGEAREDLHHLSKGVILVTHDLSPSQAATLDVKKVKGFLTNVGGKASHTAIVAKALGIPAIVGLGDISADLFGGDKIIIDGNKGIVFIRPDEKTEKEYRKKGREIHIIEKKISAEFKDLLAETLDGRKIELMGNIKSPSEIKGAINNGASGIGLYRTEFLYMEKNGNPTEEDHFKAYSKAVKYLGNRPIIIRTCDSGGDKFIDNWINRIEANPFLGQRSIRYCLEHVDIFKLQIRAILKTSAIGNVKILFPMISCLDELLAAKDILQEVMDDLCQEGIPFNKDIEVGIMIEVPSAAILADVFAKEVDFFSIGTNDLVQYTLAVDRNNEKVAHLYSPTHPAILRLIKMVIDEAAKNNTSVALCGEMGGELPNIILLVGLGLTKLSVSPSSVLPEVKRIIRSITYKKAKEVADTVCSFNDPKKINKFLRDVTNDILPGILLDN
ncbi:MAG: phosphoenolpyruvate--protein phosphotransferase [Candidatus Anammoxibacter sp.]